MAELAGLIASIGAIAGMAGTAAQFSRSLYDAAKRIRSAQIDIEEFGEKIDTFASVLRLAYHSIRRNCHNNPQSDLLIYINNHDVLSQLVRGSRRVRRRIREVQPRVETLPSSIALWARMKWVYRRPEIKALHPEMESVKTNLLLLMHVVQLEILQTVVKTSAETNEIVSNDTLREM